MSDSVNIRTEKKHADGAVMEKREMRRETACPHCGATVEEYFRTGLVGCAYCYKAFRRELLPYVIRLQGSAEHGGKEVSRDGKYEAAQSLRAAEREKFFAQKTGDTARMKKMERKEAELRLVLFGDDEEE